MGNQLPGSDLSERDLGRNGEQGLIQKLRKLLWGREPESTRAASLRQVRGKGQGAAAAACPPAPAAGRAPGPAAVPGKGTGQGRPARLPGRRGSDAEPSHPWALVGNRTPKLNLYGCSLASPSQPRNCHHREEEEEEEEEEMLHRLLAAQEPAAQQRPAGSHVPPSRADRQPMFLETQL